MAKITADLLTGARDEILSEFYRRNLDDQAPAVSEFIEDHLLSESGYRNSMALEDALRLPEIVRPVIDALIQRRLLRLEERSGILRVELTHDVLTQVARQRRGQRREAEARAKESRQLAKARQRSRRMGALAAVMLLLVIMMAFVSWNMFKARQELAASLAASDFRMGAQLALERKPREALAYLARAMRNNGDANSANLSASLLAYDIQNPLVNLQHRNGVNSAEFSPDGHQVLTASADKTAQVWDAATGLPVTAPMQHDDFVYSAKFSPDGRWLATASKDKTARVWDLMPLTQASPDFAAAVEQIAGCRFATNAGLTCAAPTLLPELRALVGHNTGLNAEEQCFLDWLAGDPQQRALSPHHSETASSRVEQLIAEGSAASLGKALNIWPSHPLALARLAEIGMSEVQGDLWAKLSLKLAPDDAAVRASAGRTISRRARLGRLTLPSGELLLSENDYNPAPAKFYNIPKAFDPSGMSDTLTQAQAFLRGDGVAQNFGHAVALLKKAALQETYAEFLLARMQANGAGMLQDKEEACRRMKALPDQGLPQMQAMLGWCSCNSENYAEGRAWYEKAAAQNYPLAISNLGYLALSGLDFEASPSQAAGFYKRSAELGYGPAALQYANMNEYGTGVAVSSEEALKWFRKAAELGETEAVMQLASFYETGTYLPQSLEQAIALYRQAAAAGDPRAQFKLATLIRDGKTTDSHAPMFWFAQAAQQGSAAGSFAVGLLYELGEGVKKDPEEARRRYQQVLDAKLPADDALRQEAELRMRLNLPHNMNAKVSAQSAR